MVWPIRIVYFRLALPCDRLLHCMQDLTLLVRHPLHAWACWCCVGAIWMIAASRARLVPEELARLTELDLFPERVAG